MQTIPLYRYTRPDGGVTVSTKKPEGAYFPMFRLVADEGYAIADGIITTYCIDTEDANQWREVPDPKATPETQLASLDTAYAEGVNSL